MKKQHDFNKIHEAALLRQARDDFSLFFLLVYGDKFELFPFTQELLNLAQVFETNDYKGMIVAAPPRSSKSETFSRLFPAWFLGRNPDKSVALVSYSEERSIDNSKIVRDIMKSKIYRAIFPETVIDPKQKSKQHFQTTKGGELFALGRFSPVTGRTMHMIIIDDIIKDANEIYSEATRRMIDAAVDTLLTRFTVNTKAIIVGTRWIQDDPIHRFYEMAKRNPKKWIVAKYPAIALEDEYSLTTGELWRKKGEAVFPFNLPVEELQKIKESIAPNIWEAVYMQSPPSEETFFQKEWLRYIDWVDIEKNISQYRVFLTIDPAYTTKQSSDRTGFCLNFVDQSGTWHLKAWGERLKPKDLAERIFQLKNQYKIERIGIEKFAFYEGFKPFLDKVALERNEYLPIKALTHSNRSKEARILAALPALYASGKIYHIKNECDLLEQEMFSFPTGEHDDVLDATSYQSALLAPMTHTFTEKEKVQYPKSILSNAGLYKNAEKEAKKIFKQKIQEIRQQMFSNANINPDI